MVNLASLVLVLLISTSVFAQKGVSFSAPLSYWSNVYLARDYSFTIVRANIIANASSTLDKNVVCSIKNAKAAGFSPDIYISLCRGTDASDQINGILSKINTTYNNVWLMVQINSVNGCKWNGYTQEDNCKFLVQAINTAIGVKTTKVGISSTNSTWTRLFGTEYCNYIGRLTPTPKLWVAYNDDKGNLDTAENIKNFKPFGGWSKPFLKRISTQVAINLSDDYPRSVSGSINWRPS